jgi:DnaK suppressor protein
VTLIAGPSISAVPAAVAARYAETYQRLVDQQATIEQLRRDLADGRGDDADKAAASLLLDEQVTLAAGLQTQLDDLEAAAERLGGYGTCATCHNTIPAERLEIFPATTMCVTCKSAAARR